MNTDGPQLTMVLFTTFLLYNSVKMISIQSQPYFEFLSFPGLVICDMILSHDAGQQVVVTSQPSNHEGQQMTLYNVFIILNDSAQL